MIIRLTLAHTHNLIKSVIFFTFGDTVQDYLVVRHTGNMPPVAKFDVRSAAEEWNDKEREKALTG